ncbi:flagellar FliJ family protein [Fodinisporobacter ferrooxydans]|uniref:Flagellar FliJ protein n=1 Tax=Fodinisporobacter ferrooxydans TaxID=2901836 RepID=A0ABY4CJM3_9BACL|nr:flagellar FliJ family protein [Alicyclobacillaceae bacterium MYW30-H2]
MNRKVATSTKIANFKKHLRGTAELEYEEACNQLNAWQKKLDDKQREVHEAQSSVSIALEARMHTAEIVSWQRFIDVCKQQMAELSMHCQRTEALCKEKRERLIESYQEEQKWIEYRNRQIILQKKALEFSEQKFLDELAVQRNSRPE